MTYGGFIPYGRQWIDEDDIAAVVEVLRSDWLTTGPKVKEFEEAFATYVNAEYAVSFSSGTAALHAAAFAAGFGPGDEVITTPITFVATANCILYMGATPVFADIDPRTYNIDPEQVARKVTPRTKAVIPVHFAGQPCDLDAIHQVAREHGLVVIEDAAHALGAEYKGKRIGGLSDMTIFSFHPVKHITTGEGGMVTTNSRQLYEKLVMFRNHGITREREKWRVWRENIGTNADQYISPQNGFGNSKLAAPWYYEVQFLGYNYRLSDIQAALGLSQLKKADYFLKCREAIAKAYNQGFAHLPGIIIPYQRDEVRSSWHLYVIQVNERTAGFNRDELFIFLRERNIGVNIHYIPVYRQPLYHHLGYCSQDFPGAEGYYHRTLTLPLFSGMKEEEIARVVSTVTQALKHGDFPS
ncbi:UDP-4-amino-4-deoxy-L-arabinose--oxoglutarate aminotransferase [Moorella thermoacetica]|uniref:UDP-4-amino-4-deoxy-L-arabinose--oxoglutarate aminotransferase n=1 Tax=Neomoorella thermoacetica TaxID=1525 RepID=A0AAC9HGK9_NEOTH|nr:UDP-4-amino-4,6-dideoxy-N-acetyl-beta-L-altrosamine transaminase [Moorella thermoacetica]AOQ23404.1 UDP-4-amino-4-deoxy-L-arabinose--oxoglutarate aminotransferase [Moorella thermoacetica]TYL06935.1 UDP-4-amino-4-deoxy-L-arabinose--oxoglutarate aminotransferase [Moorella thermoacetica]